MQVLSIDGATTEGWDGDRAAKSLRGTSGSSVMVKFARRSEQMPGVAGRPEQPPKTELKQAGPSSEIQHTLPSLEHLYCPFAGSARRSGTWSCSLYWNETAQAFCPAVLCLCSLLRAPVYKMCWQSCNYAVCSQAYLALGCAQVNLKREKLELSPVYSTAVDHDGHKLGYIRLVNFGQHAALDMQHAVQKLQACSLLGESAVHLSWTCSINPACKSSMSLADMHWTSMTSEARCASCEVAVAKDASIGMQGNGAEGFILDLRNNPGGLVRSGLDIARLWMDGDAAIFNVQGREDNGHIAIMQVRPPLSWSTPASCRGSCEQCCQTSS